MATAAALAALLSALVATILIVVRDARMQATNSRALIARVTDRVVEAPLASGPADLFWARVRTSRTPPSTDRLATEVRRREVQRAVAEIRASLARQDEEQRARAPSRVIEVPATSEPVDLFWARVRASRTPPSMDWLATEIRRREVQRAIVEIRASLARQDEMQLAA